MYPVKTNATKDAQGGYGLLEPREQLSTAVSLS